MSKENEPNPSTTEEQNAGDGNAAPKPSDGVSVLPPQATLEELQKQNAELGAQLDEARKLIASLTETNRAYNNLLNRYSHALLSVVEMVSSGK